MSLAHIGYGYYFYLMVTWLPTYLVQVRHLSLQQAGAYAVVPYLTFTVGEPIGGWLADRLVAIGWEEIFSRKLIISVSYLASLFLIPAGLLQSLDRQHLRARPGASHAMAKWAFPSES